MGVTFRANIRWPENDLLFPADWFGVRPSPGLDLSHVRALKYFPDAGDAEAAAVVRGKEWQLGHPGHDGRPGRHRPHRAVRRRRRLMA